jgi:hypothetical protein
MLKNHIYFAKLIMFQKLETTFLNIEKIRAVLRAVWSKIKSQISQPGSWGL